MPESKINTDIYFNEWLQGTDPYAAGLTFEAVSEKYGFKAEEILRLAGNEATIGTSPKAIAAAQKAAESSNFYDEPKSESLISALEENFKQDGINIDGLGFVAGNGMDSILESTIQLFTKAGDEVINITPTFVYYDFALKRHGVNIVNVSREVELAEIRVNIADVINAITEKTKLIFLCSPNNPDGALTNLDEIKKLAQVCKDRNIVLFIDHAYIEFSNRESNDARSIIQDFPNMIIGYTFSKAYAMAGYRVGYGLMHKSIQEKFMTLQSPFLLSKTSIAAAKAALADKEHLNKIISNNNEQKARLASSLEELGLKVFASDTNFLLVIVEQLEPIDFFEGLCKQGIIVRHMDKAVANSFRITVGTKEENDRLLKAIKEIIQ